VTDTAVAHTIRLCISHHALSSAVHRSSSRAPPPRITLEHRTLCVASPCVASASCPFVTRHNGGSQPRLTNLFKYREAFFISSETTWLVPGCCPRPIAAAYILAIIILSENNICQTGLICHPSQSVPQVCFSAPVVPLLRPSIIHFCTDYNPQHCFPLRLLLTTPPLITFHLFGGLRSLHLFGRFFCGGGLPRWCLERRLPFGFECSRNREPSTPHQSCNAQRIGYWTGVGGCCTCES